jgi:hypothetical protein
MQFISNSMLFSDFRQMIKTNSQNIKITKSLFYQALGCWALIEKQFPNFSHGDLHHENLLVSVIDAPYQMPFFGKVIKKYFLTIIDFGYAKTDERNPQEFHEILHIFTRFFQNDPDFFRLFIIPALAPFMKPVQKENDAHNCFIIENLLGESCPKFSTIFVTDTFDYKQYKSLYSNIQFSAEALLRLPYFDDI